VSESLTNQVRRDFLIIGQGLAGSLLAWELMQRGSSVLIVDNGLENASQVAAGLINPVTGMRFVKSAGIETLLSAARGCYSHLSDFFHQEFFVEKPMLRIFSSENERINAEKRFNNLDYQAYIGALQPGTSSFGNLAIPFGYLEQKQTGYLLTRPLLKCLKEFFISRNSYLEDEFNYHEIRFEPTLRWKDVLPRQIIFCEGYRAIWNPWFQWLPFQPVKGEILTLRRQAGLPEKILNYGNWLIPLNDREIRVGATFERESLNNRTTESAKNELLNAAGKLSPGLAHSILISHQAGIRPGTLDRHPFIGRHPVHSQLAVFNGFGAKGSLQIPWYSCHFADALLTDAPLPASCDIGRYYKK
jgi:glycine/D-amino acid oxidase-like deaminating enzyme